MVKKININKVRRYEQWRTGQLDRLYNKPCCSTNGDYLDGWYNPNQVVPEFLTTCEAFILKRHFDATYLQQNKSTKKHG